jgi:hypothetical protein
VTSTQLSPETFGAGGWAWIGTLPLAAAPTYNVFTIVHTLEGYADLMIGSDGKISLIQLGQLVS